MATILTGAPRPTADERGLVARRSSGGWGAYHRPGCARAPRLDDEDVRSVVRGPWRYLAHHWRPCPECRPPGDGGD